MNACLSVSIYLYCVVFGKQLFLRPAGRSEPIAKRMKAEQLDEEMPQKFIGPEHPEAEEAEEAPPPPPPQPPDKKKPPIQQAEDSQLDLGVQLKQEIKEEPELEGPEVKEELMEVKKELKDDKKEPGCQLKEEPQLERSHKSAHKQFAPSTKQLENEIREWEKVLEKTEAEEKKSSETPSAAQPELSQEEKPEEQAQSSASTKMSEEEKKKAASDMNRLKSLELLKAAEKKEAKKPEKGEEIQQKMRAENDAAELAAK